SLTGCIRTRRVTRSSPSGWPPPSGRSWGGGDPLADPQETQPQVLRAVGEPEGVGLRDLLLLVEGEQALVDRLEALVGRLLDGQADRVQLAPADEGLDARGVQQDLEGGDAPRSANPGDQALGD